jgi:hypothetical protein
MDHSFCIAQGAKMPGALKAKLISDPACPYAGNGMHGRFAQETAQFRVQTKERFPVQSGW